MASICHGIFHIWTEPEEVVDNVDLLLVWFFYPPEWRVPIRPDYIQQSRTHGTVRTIYYTPE